MADPMVVVGVDGTADSLSALNAAARLADETGAGLVVVYVRHESAVASVSDVTIDTSAALKEALDQIEANNRERIRDVLAGRSVRWDLEVASGDPATELIAAARHHQATAIVVGGRNHGVVSGLVVGSVAQKLVRHSPVSVLVVRDGQTERITERPAGV